MVILLIVTLSVVIYYVYTRYDPKLDLVKSGEKYELFLWFNKYDWWGEYKRVHIKLY